MYVFNLVPYFSVRFTQLCGQLPIPCNSILQIILASRYLQLIGHRNWHKVSANHEPYPPAAAFLRFLYSKTKSFSKLERDFFKALSFILVLVRMANKLVGFYLNIFSTNTADKMIKII